jgi:CHRD domain
MRQFPVLLAVGLVLGFGSVGCDKPAKDVSLFQADLTGGGEVPPRGTPAVGTVGLYVDGNTVDYTIEVHGITAITGAHIHSGAPGVNGSIRIALYPGPGTNFSATPTGGVEGILISGSFNSSQVTGVTYEELLNQMRAGTAYANVHTTQFPGGEMRGQVHLVR